MIRTLEKKIGDKSALIAVIGLGYVGLPLAAEFANNGFKTIGIDSDPEKIDALLGDRSYVDDVESGILERHRDAGRFLPTSDYGKLAEADCICVCVPTPLNKTKDPDVSFIINATRRVRDSLRPGQVISFESTTYPGTTRELILPILEERGYTVGKDFYLAFSPERIDPGNARFRVNNIPKVVAGVTKACSAAAKLFYEQIIEKVVVVSSPEAAEMTKLLENTFRIVNIGLVNEIAIMCDKLNIDVWEVIDAASTKPFGFMKFYPGPGLGGHCIPIDPHYLSWKLRLLNYKARFIELAGEINSEMPEFVVGKVTEGLNRRRKAVNGADILIIGVAYKKDIGDVRESPAIDIFQILRGKGARVRYHDPYVPSLAVKNMVFKSSRLTGAGISRADCVVVVTDHSSIDYKQIHKHASLIIDTRNVFRSGTNKVIKL